MTEPAAGAVLEGVESERWRISGRLNVASVTELWPRLRDRFRAGESVIIDLSGADRVDSAGVALLIALSRQASAAAAELRFSGVPAQALALAKVSDLEDFLRRRSYDNGRVGQED